MPSARVRSATSGSRLADGSSVKSRCRSTGAPGAGPPRRRGRGAPRGRCRRTGSRRPQCAPSVIAASSRCRHARRLEAVLREGDQLQRRPGRLRQLVVQRSRSSPTSGPISTCALAATTSVAAQAFQRSHRQVAHLGGVGRRHAARRPPAAPRPALRWRRRGRGTPCRGGRARRPARAAPQGRLRRDPPSVEAVPAGSTSATRPSSSTRSQPVGCLAGTGPGTAVSTAAAGGRPRGVAGQHVAEVLAERAAASPRPARRRPARAGALTARSAATPRPGRRLRPTRQPLDRPDRQVGVGAGRQLADLALPAEARGAVPGRHREHVAGGERGRSGPETVGHQGHPRLEPHRGRVGVGRAVDADARRVTPAASRSVTGAIPTPISRPAVAQCATPTPAAPSRTTSSARGEQRVRDPGAVAEVADRLEPVDRPHPVQGEAVVLVGGVAGQVGVQPDVERLGQLGHRGHEAVGGAEDRVRPERDLQPRPWLRSW